MTDPRLLGFWWKNQPFFCVTIVFLIVAWRVGWTLQFVTFRYLKRIFRVGGGGTVVFQCKNTCKSRVKETWLDRIQCYCRRKTICQVVAKEKVTATNATGTIVIIMPTSKNTHTSQQGNKLKQHVQ